MSSFRKRGTAAVCVIVAVSCFYLWVSWEESEPKVEQRIQKTNTLLESEFDEEKIDAVSEEPLDSLEMPLTYSEQLGLLADNLLENEFREMANLHYIKLNEGTWPDVNELEQFLDAHAADFAEMEALLYAGDQLVLEGREVEFAAGVVFPRMAKYILLKSVFHLLRGDGSEAIFQSQSLLKMARRIEEAQASLFPSGSAIRARDFYHRFSAMILESVEGAGAAVGALKEGLVVGGVGVRFNDVMLESDFALQHRGLMDRWDTFEENAKMAISDAALESLEKDLLWAQETFHGALSEFNGRPWNELAAEMIELRKEVSAIEVSARFAEGDLSDPKFAESIPDAFVVEMALEHFAGTIHHFQRRYNSVANQNLMIATTAIREAEASGESIRALADLVPVYLKQVPSDPFSGEPIAYDAENGRVYCSTPVSVWERTAPRDRITAQVMPAFEMRVKP